MPITCEFEYHKPKELTAAIEVLSRYGKDAAVLAGGTDLLVWMKEGLRTPAALVDVKAIPELRRLDWDEAAHCLHVGAGVTFTELLELPMVQQRLPLLWECSHTVASVGVRNRATLAGNICSAVPSLDGAPALLAHKAVVQVAGPSGSRTIPISDWFIGPKKTALRDGELVLGVEIPAPRQESGACYVKLGRYRGEDLAQVGVGILVLSGDEGPEYRVAFCAVGPVPASARRIEEWLRGKLLTDDLIRGAQALVVDEIHPISDIRATKEYRLHMAKIMLARGLKAAVGRMAGNWGDPEVPPYGESVI